jgi:hypothetical protein
MNTLSIGHLVLFLAIPTAFGFWASSMAKKKDRTAGGFFALGFFFPVIGLLIAALISPGQPGPPPGMRAIACPRCNARQNIDPQKLSYECWQCKTVSSLGGYKRPSGY